MNASSSSSKSRKPGSKESVPIARLLSLVLCTLSTSSSLQAIPSAAEAKGCVLGREDLG
jgi:hypothetical protein